MKRMKLNHALAVLCAAVLPSVGLGAAAPASETPTSEQAHELLGKVYLHNLSTLDKARVAIVQSSPVCDGSIGLTIYTVQLPDQPTEYYAVAQGANGKVVDGAMLGHMGDALCLALPEDHRGEVRYEPGKDLTVAIAGDSVKVTRTYDFYSTQLGGNYFHKQGEIICGFVARPDGMLERIAPVATAVEKRGSANYLDPDRPKDTYTNTKGEYFGLGMSAMRVAQMPLSEELDMTALNAFAGMLHEVIERNGEHAKENSETMSVVEFARWSTNMGLRNGAEYLTWIARHPDDEKFTRFIQVCVEENECDELAWLKQQVKALKDKKARKWWEKWLKSLEN